MRTASLPDSGCNVVGPIQAMLLAADRLRTVSGSFGRLCATRPTKALQGGCFASTLNSSEEGAMPAVVALAAAAWATRPDFVSFEAYVSRLVRRGLGSWPGERVPIGVPQLSAEADGAP